MAPFSAVTRTVIKLAPSFRGMEPLGEPLVTVVPLTVTVAAEWLTVGVTVVFATPEPTLTV